MSAKYGFRFDLPIRATTEAETGEATPPDSSRSPGTPSGVLLTYGALWALLGFAVLFVLGTMDAERREFWSLLFVLQYAAWTIGVCFMSVAACRLRRNSWQRSADSADARC